MDCSQFTTSPANVPPRTTKGPWKLGRCDGETRSRELDVTNLGTGARRLVRPHCLHHVVKDLMQTRRIVKLGDHLIKVEPESIIVVEMLHRGVEDGEWDGTSQCRCGIEVFQGLLDSLVIAPTGVNVLARDRRQRDHVGVSVEFFIFNRFRPLTSLVESQYPLTCHQLGDIDQFQFGVLNPQHLSALAKP
ncbi:unnamed protein product [Penicillium pancosmium]